MAYGKYRIPLPPAVPPRHKDNFPYWTGLSRALEIRIEALSTAYLLTGERKYADLAKTWMLAICDWPQWTDPDLDIADACLDTGHFCYAAAFTYDFCYDALTEAERLKLRGTLLDKGAAAVMRAGETGWARTMSWPNGFAVVMGGMGIAGMATLGDDERAEGYVQYSRRRLYEFLSAQDRDGGYVEGLLYGGYAIDRREEHRGALDVVLQHRHRRGAALQPGEELVDNGVVPLVLRLQQGHLVHVDAALLAFPDPDDKIAVHHHRALLALGAVVFAVPGVLQAGLVAVALIVDHHVVGHAGEVMRVALAVEAAPAGVPFPAGDTAAVGTAEVAEHVEMVHGALDEQGVGNLVTKGAPGAADAVVGREAPHQVVDRSSRRGWGSTGSHRPCLRT